MKNKFYSNRKFSSAMHWGIFLVSSFLSQIAFAQPLCLRWDSLESSCVTSMAIHKARVVEVQNLKGSDRIEIVLEVKETLRGCECERIRSFIDVSYKDEKLRARLADQFVELRDGGLPKIFMGQWQGATVEDWNTESETGTGLLQLKNLTHENLLHENLAGSFDPARAHSMQNRLKPIENEEKLVEAIKKRLSAVSRLRVLSFRLCRVAFSYKRPERSNDFGWRQNSGGLSCWRT